jgi:prophage tail gpP-like protein
VTYTVQPGDTLNGIAIKFLGSASPATTLFQINRSVIKSGSPSLLATGEKLVIPDQMIAASKGSRKTAKGSTDVALLVNGVEYVGWQSVKIMRSMETAAASFEVEAFDRWEPGEEPWPIFDFDEVKVFIGPDLLIDGHVDEVNLGIDAGAHTMRVSGRDRTADLVDCSAMNRPGTFTNIKLEVLAQRLTQPFGVKVVCDQDTGAPIAKFALLPGEKVHEAIARGAIAKNLIVTSGLSGVLAITRSGTRRAKDAIVEGKNLKSGESKASSIERFSDYTVEGQDSGQGKAKNGMKATYHDAGVPRYRPWMGHCEQKATAEYVKARAEWEARARAAKARGANVVVQGWRQSNGILWQTNRLVAAHSPSLGLDEDLLIGEVTFELSSSSGMTVMLKLVRPDAYSSEEELKAAKDIIKENRLERRRHRKGRARGVSAAEIAAELDSLKPFENDDY